MSVCLESMHANTTVEAAIKTSSKISLPSHDPHTVSKRSQPLSASSHEGRGNMHLHSKVQHVPARLGRSFSAEGGSRRLLLFLLESCVSGHGRRTHSAAKTPQRSFRLCRHAISQRSLTLWSWSLRAFCLAFAAGTHLLRPSRS